MDTVASCNNRLLHFWRKNPDAAFAVSPALTEDQIVSMEGRYRSMPNPNRKGDAWRTQEGDEGIGTRYTRSRSRMVAKQPSRITVSGRHATATV
jgi:hypothetical protein